MLFLQGCRCPRCSVLFSKRSRRSKGRCPGELHLWDTSRQRMPERLDRLKSLFTPQCQRAPKRLGHRRRDGRCELVCWLEWVTRWTPTPRSWRDGVGSNRRGQQGVTRCSQGIDIGARRGSTTILFRCRITRCPVSKRNRFGVWVVFLGGAKINQDGLSGSCRHDDIRRFDVAMHDRRGLAMPRKHRISQPGPHPPPLRPCPTPGRCGSSASLPVPSPYAKR